jgi:hypothetical protein
MTRRPKRLQERRLLTIAPVLVPCRAWESTTSVVSRESGKEKGKREDERTKVRIFLKVRLRVLVLPPSTLKLLRGRRVQP